MKKDPGQAGVTTLAYEGVSNFIMVECKCKQTRP
jgi:hypothetical protein